MVGFVAVPARDEQGMMTPTCVAAAEPSNIDFSTLTLREPNLPYPGRMAAVDPMPTEMPDPIDDMTPTDNTEDMPIDRPTVLMTSSDDSGCTTAASNQGAVWLFGVVFLMGMRRRRQAA
jgi:MYXO-CTERM domain-containing protein